MAPGVLHQVVAAHEALVTKRAPEFLLPRVGAVVAGQLVGAGELLTAVGPGAWERPFSCNTRGGGESQRLNHTRRWQHGTEDNSPLIQFLSFTLAQFPPC